MHLIELLVGTSAVLAYMLARLDQQRQVLLADGVFLGIALFFYGAWFEAGRLHYIPGADEVLFLATLAMVGAALAGCMLRPIYRGIPPILAAPRPLDPRFVYVTAAGVIAFNIAFSYVVFSSLLGGSLQGLSEESGLLAIRKLIATGEEGHLFPGLVKQVRDILAPALILYLMAYTPRGRNRVLVCGIGASTLLAMFIGGQRTPILIFGWAAYLGRRISAKSRTSSLQVKRNWMRAAGYVVLGLPILAAINSLLGRAVAGANPIQLLVDTFYGVFERLVLTVPRESIEGYQFITALETGFGELWLTDLATLAPGTQSGLSNQLHSYLGGSTAGNAVLGLPLGSYVNAGYVGVLLTPMVFMFCAALLDRLVSRMDSPLVSSARYIVLAYIPLAYNPYLFLLNGGLFLAFIITMVALRPRTRLRL